jgi:type III secretory pathway component EscT
MEKIFEAVGHRQDWIQVGMIGLLMIMRIVPVTFLTPFLGGKLTPAETKMSLSMGLTAFCFEYANEWMHGPLSVNGIAYIVLMLKELLIGTVIGFVSTELYYALDVAGRTLDTMRGSNMAEVQVPELGTRASPIGDYGFHLLLVVFFAINGHIIFIQSMVSSFRLIPVDAFPTTQAGFKEIVETILHYTSSMFPIAFGLVFPGLFAAFMIDITFGMLNRVAPQLNAYQLSMGIKSLMGIAFFLLALTLFIPQVAIYAHESVNVVQYVVTLFAH